jgi:ferredoxin-NADP reductase
METRDSGPGLRELRFATTDGPLPHRAGQWLSFRVAGEGEADQGVWRPYALSSAPVECADPGAPEAFTLLAAVDLAGPGAARLRSLAPGDSLEYLGPHGELMLQSASPAEAVLIADGVGIGPIRALVASLIRPDPPAFPVLVVHEAPVPLALAYRDDFERWEQELSRLRYLPTVPGADSNWHGETRELRELVPDLFRDTEGLADRHWYLCGSGRHTDFLAQWLLDRGVRAQAVRVEKFFD